MRHIDTFELTISGNGHTFLAAEIPASMADTIQELLKKRKVETQTVSARKLFPDLFDPQKGPGIALKGARLREKLTQMELAERLGVRQHHLSEMENGKRPIGKEMAKKLGAVLHTNWRVFI